MKWSWRAAITFDKATTVGWMQDYSRTRRNAAIAAGVSASLVVGMYLLYVCTVIGRRLDTHAMRAASGSEGGFLRAAKLVLDAVSIAAVIVALACVVIAIVRRRYRVAVASILIVAGANGTTQLLKAAIFLRPEIGFEDYLPASLPSGHVTMAASISLATLIAVPVAWRWWIALTGTFITFLVGWSTVVSQWHRPADVVAAVLVSLAWAALAVAVGGRWVVAPTEVPGTSVSRRLQSTAKPMTALNLRRVWIGLLAVGVGGIAIGIVANVYGFAQLWRSIDRYAVTGSYFGSIVGYLGVICGATAVLLALMDRENFRPAQRNVP